MIKKIVLFLVLLLSLLSITFVASVTIEQESSYVPDLFGIHETLAYRNLHENLNISRAFEIMHSLGVRKIRMNSWRSSFMLNSTEINASARDAIEWVIHKADSLGIEIMGYAEDFPYWMTDINEDFRAVPSRNTTKYSVFRERYEKSWETLASEFPEITVWEIGNEYNLHEFLRPQSGIFSPQERVDIVTDLLYYGSRGINATNHNATRVMCGLGPFEDTSYGNGIYNITDFLDSIYENIESGRWPSTNPDDFFQVACWHPYTFKEKPTKQNWVDPNKAVYEIMKKHGDGDKRVVFSEMGYSDNAQSPKYASRDKIPEYLSEAFRLARNNFPWLDTIYWYRLTDRDLIYEGGRFSQMDGYGVIESPETWTWKLAAYAYQSLTHPFPWQTLSLVSGISLPIVIAVFVLYLLKSARTSSSSKRVVGLKVADLCGVITPVIVLTLISLAISYSPEFSWAENALSDLGVRGTSAIFFNSSLIIGGFLTLMFAVGLREIFLNRTLGHAGTLILILATVGLCSIGIFTKTAGAIHFYVSVAFFTLLPISLFFIGAAMIKESLERNLGLFTVLASVVMIVVWTLPWKGGVAIPEIVASLAASVLSIVFGVRLFRQASRSIGKN